MPTRITVSIRVELEEVPGKGWVAEAPDVAAIAQGETQEQALTNLREVVEVYPEVMEPLIEQAIKARRIKVDPVPA